MNRSWHAWSKRLRFPDSAWSFEGPGPRSFHLLISRVTCLISQSLKLSSSIYGIEFRPVKIQSFLLCSRSSSCFFFHRFFFQFLLLGFRLLCILFSRLVKQLDKDEQYLYYCSKKEKCLCKWIARPCVSA